MTTKEKKLSAVYKWLVNEGTPGRIASMIIYLMPYSKICQIIKEENINIKNS